MRDGKTGQLCDSKAIVGAAFGYQFPDEGPLKSADFSGGEATVVPRLQRLGFETNGGHTSSFIISRNELDFAKEAEGAFHLYRVFQFREAPKLYILNGRLADQLHLEPIDFRASFRRLVG